MLEELKADKCQSLGVKPGNLVAYLELLTKEILALEKRGVPDTPDEVPKKE
jgi:hypothetical protein